MVDEHQSFQVRILAGSSPKLIKLGRRSCEPPTQVARVRGDSVKIRGCVCIRGSSAAQIHVRASVRAPPPPPRQVGFSERGPKCFRPQNSPVWVGFTRSREGSARSISAVFAACRCPSVSAGARSLHPLPCPSLLSADAGLMWY